MMCCYQTHDLIKWGNRKETQPESNLPGIIPQIVPNPYHTDPCNICSNITWVTHLLIPRIIWHYLSHKSKNSWLWGPTNSIPLGGTVMGFHSATAVPRNVTHAGDSPYCDITRSLIGWLICREHMEYGSCPISVSPSRSVVPVWSRFLEWYLQVLYKSRRKGVKNRYWWMLASCDPVHLSNRSSIKNHLCYE